MAAPSLQSHLFVRTLLQQHSMDTVEQRQPWVSNTTKHLSAAAWQQPEALRRAAFVAAAEPAWLAPASGSKLVLLTKPALIPLFRKGIRGRACCCWGEMNHSSVSSCRRQNVAGLRCAQLTAPWPPDHAKGGITYRLPPSPEQLPPVHFLSQHIVNTLAPQRACSPGGCCFLW